MTGPTPTTGAHHDRPHAGGLEPQVPSLPRPQPGPVLLRLPLPGQGRSHEPLSVRVVPGKPPRVLHRPQQGPRLLRVVVTVPPGSPWGRRQGSSGVSTPGHLSHVGRGVRGGCSSPAPPWVVRYPKGGRP